MQLVEQGKLDLDRDINAYLDFEIAPLDGKPITLRHVMTHTAGFEETVKSAATIDPQQVVPLEQYLKAWTPKRIYPPGEVPAYSNYATSLAGYIVQRLSGESFPEYIRRHILEPLEMRSSSFQQPLPPELRSRLSQGYPVASQPPGAYEIFATSPAGNLAATGDDMARFMIAHLNQGAYGDSRILEPATAQLMHGTAWTVLPGVNRMLLGFYETHRNGRTIIAHGGDTQLFHSFAHLFVDEGVGLYIALNSTGIRYSSSGIRAGLFEQFADRYFPGPTADGSVDARLAAEHAASMAGIYRNSRRSAANFLAINDLLNPTQVSVNGDGTLSVNKFTDFSDQPKSWREISPFVWRDVRGEDFLAAKLVAGKVNMFSTDESSPYTVYQPYSWWDSPSWRAPAFKLSLAALALTLLLWPIRALVRRYYRVSGNLAGREARIHLGMRIGAAAVFLVLFAWLGTFSKMEATGMPLTAEEDWWFWVLNIAGFVVFAGAALIALANIAVVWRSSQPWFAKLWSVALGFACWTVVWVAGAYKLVSLNVNY
jgi:CubicO group peptidase (beta-lactamase class C family)